MGSCLSAPKHHHSRRPSYHHGHQDHGHRHQEDHHREHGHSRTQSHPPVAQNGHLNSHQHGDHGSKHHGNDAKSRKNEVGPQAGAPSHKPSHKPHPSDTSSPEPVDLYLLKHVSLDDLEMENKLYHQPNGTVVDYTMSFKKCKRVPTSDLSKVNQKVQESMSSKVIFASYMKPVGNAGKPLKEIWNQPIKQHALLQPPVVYSS